MWCEDHDRQPVDWMRVSIFSYVAHMFGFIRTLKSCVCCVVHPCVQCTCLFQTIGITNQIPHSWIMRHNYYDNLFIIIIILMSRKMKHKLQCCYNLLPFDATDIWRHSNRYQRQSFIIRQETVLRERRISSPLHTMQSVFAGNSGLIGRRINYGNACWNRNYSC